VDGLARILVIAGAALLLLGGVFWAFSRTGLGRLPGDISFSTGNVSFYMPLVSMLIVSLVLTVILNVVFRIFR